MPNTVPAPSSSRMIPMASRVAVKAHAHAQADQNGGEHLVLAGEHLRPAQDDAVDHNQGQEHAQGVVQRGGEGLDKQLHNGDKPRHNGDKGRDAHLVRDDLAQQGNHRVGAHQHKVGWRHPCQWRWRRRWSRPNVAQQPSTSRSTGFSLMIPLVNSWSRPFFFSAISRAPFHGVVLRNGLVTALVTAVEVTVAACHGLDLALARCLVLDDLQAALRGLLQELV